MKVQAQPTELHFSREQKFPLGTYFQGFSTEIADTVFILRADKSGKSADYQLIKFTEKKLNHAGEISFKGVSEENKFVGLFHFHQGPLVLLSTEKKEKEKLKFLYAQIFDLQGNPLAAPKTISKVELKETEKEGSFYFTLSENGEELMVITQKTSPKFNNETLRIMTLDKSLNLLKGKEVEIPYSSQAFSFIDYKLNYSGHIVLLATIFPETYMKTEKVASDNYLLFTYHPDENELQEFEINLDQKWVTEIDMQVSGKGELIISGYYSNNREHIANGVFFMKVDPETNTVTSGNLKAFSQNTLQHYIKEKDASKGKGIPDFLLKRSFVINDKTYLIGEQSYTLKDCYTQFRTGLVTCDYHYYNLGILINELNAEGNITETVHIPKKQHTSNDNGYHSSFSAFFMNDSLRFLYNDNPKNQDRYSSGNIKFMNNPSKSIVTMASYGEERKIKYRTLGSSKKDGNILKPRVLHYSSDNVLLFYVKHRKYNLVRLEF